MRFHFPIVIIDEDFRSENASGGFYLLREHWIHVAGNWVYLLLLACPLMHLLHGHGGDGGHGAPPDKPANREA